MAGKKVLPWVKIARSHVVLALEQADILQAETHTVSYQYYDIVVKKVSNGWNVRYFGKRPLAELEKKEEADRVKKAKASFGPSGNLVIEGATDARN